MENKVDSSVLMDGDSAKQKLVPRKYQVELMNIILNQNTIIFLPTGSGKTFIAVMCLKRMGETMVKSYSEGGKISLILVNTVALVDQHAKYVTDLTSFTVGKYSGEMNLDFWPKDKWYTEFNKYQVLVMTSQILLNLVHQNFLDLNRVQLLIFDECHHGVNDHSMRQLIKSAFQPLTDPPRVLGLTATLLNGNCKPHKVMDQVQILETTYLSKVATVEGLEDVIGFSTNPIEKIWYFDQYVVSSLEANVLSILSDVSSRIMEFKGIESNAPKLVIPVGLESLSKEEGLKRLKNSLIDVQTHIKTFGLYGGNKSIIAHLINVERIKRHCPTAEVLKIFNYVETLLTYCKFLFERKLNQYPEIIQIFKFSSDQMLHVIQILTDFKDKCKEELCGIIFVERRFTAKVLFYILDALRKCDPKYEFIKPDFVVGSNSNPYNNTRENLYKTKKNRQIIESFARKEINVLCASNVLEEGIDMPRCSLVLKFDRPKDYRSYVQSKGRARHRSSLYYILVDRNDEQFKYLYPEFKEVENTLNKYLLGKNDERAEPSEEEIEKMYNEDEFPPYYVDGPHSAQVNMRSAISLLSQYCMALPGDKYTIHAPELFFSTKRDGKYVVIYLPTISPIIDPIEGPVAKNIKVAKRAAHLKACIALHKCGELDDHLLPRKRELKEEDVGFLFKHYPKQKEPQAGTNKNKRIHKKQVATCLVGQIYPKKEAFLHIVELIPNFSKPNGILNASIYDIYTNNLCYGLLTPNPCPSICDFPLFVYIGTLTVSLKKNVKTVCLTEDQLKDIKEFNVMVLTDVLSNVLRSFLIMDNSSDAETMLFVPVNKIENEINFEVLKQHKSLKTVQELTTDEKLSLNVTVDGYLNKIVTPWYIESGNFLVLEVTLSKNALSLFPNEDYGTFKDYYKAKHNRTILNPSAPLLYVKSLTKNKNFYKPIGAEKKRKKDKQYEEMDLYLLPELVVKQEFPACLFIQANFLPCIVSRIVYLLQLEELRTKIARETNLGKQVVDIKKPLQLDNDLIVYEPYLGETNKVNAVSLDETKDVTEFSSISCNKDYVTKTIEREYPWKDIEEPKDIERCLDVTVMDLEYYENFISHKVSEREFLLKNESPQKINKLALTYERDYVYKSIKFLETRLTGEGPELCEIYRAMTTAKANDIVNMERLETLGDSFLKYISSIYILTKFPDFDEGRATALKGRIVSNKNLYYLASKKNFGGIIKNADLSIHDWLPPSFSVPQKLKEDQRTSAHFISFLQIPFEEQASGKLSDETIKYIDEVATHEHNETQEEGLLASMYQTQYIGDKIIADSVEALLGAYFEKCGIEGGIKFIEWMGIIPASENLKSLLEKPAADPLINKRSTLRDINSHIPNWVDIERILDYQFKNKAFLLQALTHSSYSCNRITQSYENLEFLGDAILDFLITCHIYENYEHLDPGQLTDLRSALVNNTTFASYVVRHDLHKCLLLFNSILQQHITRFADFMASKHFQIDDEVLILLQDTDFNLAEYIDVPKVLGDVFEALAGAIYLDSGKCLKTVWRVFHKIMYNEISNFGANIPKNTVRRLYEYSPTWSPTFSQAIPADGSPGKMMVAVSFMLDGHKMQVHGFGSNKYAAKTAAAKIALRLLNN